MKILITGGRGMLGRTLQRHLCEHDLFIADLPELDITDVVSVNAAMDRFRPDVVVHCAAMTAVDGCESDPDMAYKVNALGSAVVAAAAHRVRSRIIAISTDYVFDGKADRLYDEFDQPAPQTVYGASKLAGEEAVRAHCPEHTILRIAWLYGDTGPSFLHTMLKLGAQDGPPLNVVNDQIGNPTSTDAVAGLIGRLIKAPLPGIVHGSCEGAVTWFEFAKEIFEIYGLKRKLIPCTTLEFTRPAPRPANSRLDKRILRLAGLEPMAHWRDALVNFEKDGRII
jgi:dTDP-4-dehydrorhamnose reductase